MHIWYLHTCVPSQVQLQDFRAGTILLPDNDKLHLPQFSSLATGSPGYLRSCVLLLFFLQVNIDKDRSLLLDWDRVRVFDREIAQMFLNMTKMEKEAQVGLLYPHLSSFLAWG